MDHDQRFKALIREFFPDFMRLFFPKWADYLDLASTQWVEKEVLPNPPDGSRHVLDLVAQLRTNTPGADGGEALRRLAEAPVNEFQRFLLSDCVQAYLPLDSEGLAIFERITQAEPYSKVKAMNKTPYDMGIEKGIEKGIAQGKEEGMELGSLDTLRTVAMALLESRFQTVPETFAQSILQLPAPALHTLIIKIPNASAVNELFDS
jgi:hypothetical protein